MSATFTTDGVAMPTGRLVRAYLVECKYELLRLMRVPAFVAPILVLPLFMFILFGLVLPFSRDEVARRTVLISFCIFGAISPGLFGFGIGVAAERSQGLLTLKRVQPIPQGAYLIAKMVMAILCAMLVCLLLASFALLTHTVDLSTPESLMLVGLGGVCVIPFCAIGLFIGSVTSAQIAPMVANLFYLMMSALSGLWVPLRFMPTALQRAAVIWPSYHVVKIVGFLFGVEKAQTFPIPSLIVLAGITAISFSCAAWKLAGDEQ